MGQPRAKVLVLWNARLHRVVGSSHGGPSAGETQLWFGGDLIPPLILPCCRSGLPLVGLGSLKRWCFIILVSLLTLNCGDWLREGRRKAEMIFQMYRVREACGLQLSRCPRAQHSFPSPGANVELIVYQFVSFQKGLIVELGLLFPWIS